MGTGIAITRAALAMIAAETARALPHEACGLLLGAGATVRIAQPCANVAADPACRFEIDPAALIAAHRAARAGGPALLGYYHSHPRGAAAPSAADRAGAAGDGRLWAIADAAGALTLWRDAPGGFEALCYRVIDSWSKDGDW